LHAFCTLIVGSAEFSTIFVSTSLYTSVFPFPLQYISLSSFLSTLFRQDHRVRMRIGMGISCTQRDPARICNNITHSSLRRRMMAITLETVDRSFSAQIAVQIAKESAPTAICTILAFQLAYPFTRSLHLTTTPTRTLHTVTAPRLPHIYIDTMLITAMTAA